LLIGLVLNAQLPPLAATQRLMFENDAVRITELRMSPSDQEPEHQHGRGVTVALGPYDNEVVSLPDRTTSKRHTDFGEVRWAEPARHETRNTGKAQQRVIRVELKGEPGPVIPSDARDSLLAVQDTQKLVLEKIGF